MSIRAFTLALFAVAALCACGLRGPLYLPDDKQPADSEQPASGDVPGKPRRPAPAPQSQKRDRETEDGAPAQSTAPPDPDRPANVPVIPPGD